ncbi:MAG: C39 family peptidase [Clostridiales bacterium]|nr:C39 family peptidase [Clostridiales bacterium]
MTRFTRLLRTISLALIFLMTTLLFPGRRICANAIVTEEEPTQAAAEITEEEPTQATEKITEEEPTQATEEITEQPAEAAEEEPTEPSEEIPDEEPTEPSEETAGKEETGEEPPETPVLYITWPFLSYAEPAFTSAIKDDYEPQTVAVLTDNQDGWVLIDTYKGSEWIYVYENLFYIDKSLDLYDQKNGAKSVGAISPQIVQVTERDGDWMLMQTWQGPKWVNLTGKKPVSANTEEDKVLLNVPSYSQRGLGYNSGCEIVSTAMMINYVQTVSVHTLVSKMPRSSDPNKGYRGDVRVLSSGFTIFPSALLSLTRSYLGSAVDMTGCSMDDLKNKLNRGAPVTVWVNGLGFNVHAVCLTGYDKTGFYYNDPWTAKKNAHIGYTSFYGIWNKAIYDKQLGRSYSTRKALSYNP